MIIIMIVYNSSERKFVEVGRAIEKTVILINFLDFLDFIRFWDCIWCG